MDYKQLGLRVGLEIHQQVEGKKLFCSCPAEIIDSEPDLKVKRKLRASAGETGEIDEAATQEQMKEKRYLYHFYNKANCLVELDEEPPHEVNKDALETCLVIAKILNAKVVDEICFMRKTVVDGSNVSGFQRTALVAIDGFLEIDVTNSLNQNHGKPQKKRISIPTICLEEESAKIVEKTPEFDVYNLSRLGIPLIEIATDPDINSPEEAKLCAEKIGMILRSTGKVKRGLGTIRQDVNVSIREGNRVEIKGAQDLKMVPTLVEYEVSRQQGIVKLKGKLRCEVKPGIKHSTALIKPSTTLNKSPTPSNNELICMDDIFKQTTCNFVKKAVESKPQTSKGAIFGFKLNGLNGKLGIELVPNKRIGTELSDFAKVRAGITGIIHSDEKLDKYNFTEDEIKKVKEKLHVKELDCFVMIVADLKKCELAYHAILERLSQLNIGVNKEVRMANADGTTSFLRPMPGAARMYPETDITGVKVTKAYLESLKMPELIAEKADRIKDYGLSKDLAELMAKRNKTELFEKFVSRFPSLKPAFIAETMLPKILHMKRKYSLNDEELRKLEDESNLEVIFSALNNLGTDCAEDILLDMAKKGKIDESRFSSKPLSDAELEKGIKDIVDKNKNASFGAVMGQAMAKYKGKADGRKISEILKKFHKQT